MTGLVGEKMMQHLYLTFYRAAFCFNIDLDELKLIPRFQNQPSMTTQKGMFSVFFQLISMAAKTDFFNESESYPPVCTGPLNLLSEKACNHKTSRIPLKKNIV